MAPGRGPTSFVGNQPKALSDMAPTLDWMVGDPAKYVALAFFRPLAPLTGTGLGGCCAVEVVGLSYLETATSSTRARAAVGATAVQMSLNRGIPPAG